MESTPVTETTSPLTREQAEQLNRLTESLAPDQATWISGYLAGLVAAGGGVPQAAEAPGAAVATEPVTLTVLAGSQTGNALALAERAAEKAREIGFQAVVQDMGDYKNKRLREESHLLVITSTHGDGDPPDNAADLHEYLHSRKAPKLEGTHYAVLSLGDRSYDYFCQTGKDFDKRLEELGASRIAQRVDCDVDYEEPAEEWIQQVLTTLAEQTEVTQSTSSGGDSGNVVSLRSSREGKAEASPYSRKNPFPATVLENQVITGRGSNKETRHVEVSLEGSGLTYEPGDSLGIYPVNRQEAVTELIEALGLEREAPVAIPGGGEAPLEEALRRHYEIRLLSPPVIEAYAELAGSDALRSLAREDNRKALREYIADRELIDLVADYPVSKVPAAEFVATLRPLQARLYSVASSPTANPDEVHLTIGILCYESQGRTRYGVTSNWVAETVEEGDVLPVYVQRNPNFRLPEDSSAPTIMVGPGTGIAPFRAFLEEREEQEAEGANWLFFGEQHFRTDFLYQVDWQRWWKEGLLTRVDLAFSRDQEEKVYVQHRLMERSREIYEWLQDGAYFYVCGDAERMAPAVHEALDAILQREGGMSAEGAASYIKELQREKRYQRDVY